MHNVFLWTMFHCFCCHSWVFVRRQPPVPSKKEFTEVRVTTVIDSLLLLAQILMSFFPALWTWICVECSQTCLLNWSDEFFWLIIIFPVDWMVCSLIPGKERRFFSFPKCPDYVRSPSSLLFNGYGGFFPHE